MRLLQFPSMPMPMAVRVGQPTLRPGTVTPLRNPSALKTVRNAINTRAAAIGATELRRLRAIGVALSEVRIGRSTGWAITAGIRDLRT